MGGSQERKAYQGTCYLNNAESSVVIPTLFLARHSSFAAAHSIVQADHNKSPASERVGTREFRMRVLQLQQAFTYEMISRAKREGRWKDKWTSVKREVETIKVRRAMNAGITYEANLTIFLARLTRPLVAVRTCGGVLEQA